MVRNFPYFVNRKTFRHVGLLHDQGAQNWTKNPIVGRDRLAFAPETAPAKNPIFCGWISISCPISKNVAKGPRADKGQWE